MTGSTHLQPTIYHQWIYETKSYEKDGKMKIVCKPYSYRLPRKLFLQIQRIDTASLFGNCKTTNNTADERIVFTLQ